MSLRRHRLLATAALGAAVGFASPSAHAQQGQVTVQSAAATPQAQSASASPAQAAPALGPEFQFEVASIKPSKAGNNLPPGAVGTRFMFEPDGITANNISVIALVNLAYGIQNNNQISGAPGWLDSERYDIQAKMEPAIADEVRKMKPEEARLAREVMLQRLLADRFGLKIHHETKQLQVYVLEVAKNGPKFKPTTLPPLPPPGSPDASGGPDAKNPKPMPPPPPPPRSGPDGKIQMPKGFRGAMMTMNGGQMTMVMNGASIAMLVNTLSRSLGREVVDKTGLTGEYDFTLHYTPNAATPMPNSAASSSPTSGASGAAPSAPTAAASTLPADPGPTIFAALQEQLGLKLESTKGPVEIIVIDHVERPSQN